MKISSISCILLILLVSQFCFARSELTLVYKAEIQKQYIDPEGEEWKTIFSRTVTDSIGGVQFFLEAGLKYRLVLRARKPYDISGKFRVRTPTRQDGILAPKGQDYAEIIFGPQEGCEETVPRCKPLTLDDVGNVELRMDLEESNQSSFGVMLLRPYSEEAPFAVRIALTYKDKQIQCGSQVDKGFWIFASSIKAEAVQLGTISLCVLKPDGEYKCADDQEETLKVQINQKGIYNFTAWNASPKFTDCQVEAK